ncbi:hypothetical protein [Polaribacter ponticola]|uniref:DUF3630 family protein n=1 Tax=Polaribacter ponticola TaxID=2978475 RepID=A0ABT5SB65_9FLAO|nr:hypothetical protein [Polaribacter sp. MSW5]MDD7915320.1 hypothetical protein [Polaribacter sp. MSW5]
MNSELDNSNFQFSYVDCLNNLNDFDNLINWLSNEFILYLQEENQGMKVYFPNGWFTIRFIKDGKNSYEVLINSKSKFTFTKIKEELLQAIQRFKHIKKEYSYEQLSY